MTSAARYDGRGMKYVLLLFGAFLAAEVAIHQVARLFDWLDQTTPRP